MKKNYFLNSSLLHFPNSTFFLLLFGFLTTLAAAPGKAFGEPAEKESHKLVVAGETIETVSLINANTKQVIRRVHNGATINLATLPTPSLNLRANTSPATIGSVKISLTGPQNYSRVESAAPYELFGDNLIWTPAVGTYTLEATPYSGAKGTGTAGTTVTINFRVINEAPSDVVTSLTTTTNQPYAITSLKAGTPLYTDRAYQITGVPAFLEGATLIRTANNDKTDTSDVVLTLTLAREANVYVAYDPRATVLPAWLNGWQKLTDKLPINDPRDKYLEIYTKTFPAGTVRFGGNLARPAKGALNNYVVLASPTPKSNAYLVVENPDKFPANDELVFSHIKNPWRRTTPIVTPYNRNHNQIDLKINNKGTGALVISKLTLTNSSDWRIDSINNQPYNAATSLPLSVASGSSAQIKLKFIATNDGKLVKLHAGKLIITSNDDNNPIKEITLRGLWQFKGEGINEPNSQQIINAFGFTTRTGYKQNDGANDGTAIVPNSDEIISDYFVRADASRPVSVVQMAAYHGCCRQAEQFQWYDKESSAVKTLFFHDPLDGQSLLPRRARTGGVAPAAGTFSPTAPFGFLVETSYSDRTKNFENRIGMRIWKAIDANGNIIPDAYIVGTDYLGTTSTNYDYQDNVYFISNIRPQSGSAYHSELAALPSAVTFGSVMSGTSKSVSVKLKNQGNNFNSGSNDPAIQITNVELVGPNRNDFSLLYGAGISLNPQGTTTFQVNFSPKSRGLKNAALLVYYNSGQSPLRIPLYGIANTDNSSIVISKRIKGGSDANVTISGDIWESDKNYRKGSVRLDQQVVAGPIAGTEDDVLYQTYLSATTNLAPTSLEVPTENGTYQIRFHFVENFFDATGARVFDISLENQVRLAHLDIHQEVGYRAALVKDFEVTVTDGLLNMNFTPTANRLALAGVEIYKVTSNATGQTARVATTLEESVTTSEAPELLLFPNPSRGEQVKVEVKNFGKQEQVTLDLLDATGRTLKSVTVQSDAGGVASITLPSSELTNGLYIIRAHGSSGQAQSKLLIEK